MNLRTLRFLIINQHKKEIIYIILINTNFIFNYYCSFNNNFKIININEDLIINN